VERPGVLFASLAESRQILPAARVAPPAAEPL